MASKVHQRSCPGCGGDELRLVESPIFACQACGAAVWRRDDGTQRLASRAELNRLGGGHEQAWHRQSGGARPEPLCREDLGDVDRASADYVATIRMSELARSELLEAVGRANLGEPGLSINVWCVRQLMRAAAAERRGRPFDGRAAEES